jgi:hypothetical protein
MKAPIEPCKITFEDLSKYFERKIFAIPEIQREFVWTKKKIIDLLDSIKKHYPIGSFLICKVPASKVKYIRESTVLPSFDNHRNKECYLVIDGQQRLSVIYSVLNGKKTDQTRYLDGIDFKQIAISPRREKESEFDFYNTYEEHIKLYDILNDNLKHNISKAKKKRIMECQRAFKTYSFPFIFLSDYDEDKMREAFIRLNKGGTSLSSEDKIFALAYHKDTDLRRHCRQLLHDLKKGFDYFDRIHFIRAIAANLGVNDVAGSLDTFAKKIKNPRDKMHELYKDKHKRIFYSIRSAADFLSKRIKHASYIPYPAMLSILSVFYFHNNNHPPSDKQMKEIEKWFWTTGFTKRYSGGNQRYNLMNDVSEMKKLAESKKYKLQLEGKMRIEPLSLKALEKTRYNKPGALRNAFFCYLIHNKPLNFSNGEPISIDEVNSIFNIKNDHHIFPKDVLIKYYYKEYIDNVFNICFITFGENIAIKNKPPWVYLKEYKRSTRFSRIMESHVLPVSKSLLERGDVKEKFESFIKERKNMIKKDIIRLIGQKYVID